MYEGLKNESSDIEVLTSGSHQQAMAPVLDEALRNEKDEFIFQLLQQYVVSRVKSGLLFVDQQKAHERILYEKYLQRMKRGSGPAQQNLFPQSIEFSCGDYDRIKEIQDDLRSLGFDIREFGSNTFVLHGSPPELEPGKEKQALESLLEEFKNNKALNHIDHHELLARSMAKNMSVKNGMSLSPEEMKNLLDELFACEKPSMGLDGKATLVLMNMDTVRKLF